jgi:hypothetical protein
MNHYNIIEYFSILSVIPHRWKLLIGGIGKLDLIENDILIDKRYPRRIYNIIKLSPNVGSYRKKSWTC